MEKIMIIGMGYVGLSTSVCFSEKISTVGIDIDKEKIAKLSKSIPTFYEKGLQNKLKNSVKIKKLKFTDDIDHGFENSNIIFISVGTPNLDDGNVDFLFIKEVCKRLGKCLQKTKEFKIIVNKSTVPPGTMKDIIKPELEKISGKKSGKDFGLCSNPEFLREGSAIKDTLYPDRVVIGTEDDKTLDSMKKLYNKIYKHKKINYIFTNPTNAEFIKYASNAFLAMKISFTNNIAKICQATPDSDIVQIAKGVGLDKRIGNQFLNAGLGYGGSCFPKDVKGLIHYSKKIGIKSDLLEQIDKTNNSQPEEALKLAKKLAGSLDKKTVSILGASFKPNTDDIRESISVKIIKKLLKLKCKIRVHDPMALDNLKMVFQDRIIYCTDLKECLKNSDCCILVTEWDIYKSLKASDFKNAMNSPVLIDGRRLFEPKKFADIKYGAIGLS